MRTISPFEFVRRFHHGVTKHDGRYVWFLGAGCSVSSGIGDASSTVMRWLGELKYLETGEHGEVARWAPKRFPAFDADDPAALYADVLHALFYTDQEKERELERINATAEPGFGYATLAQMITQAEWGDRCNTLVTTNFDDLAADALYLYSQQKPQVLTHESFDRRVRISTSRPTILKIYGDAHLTQSTDGANMPMLRSDVKDRLRAQFTESAIVFVGYGGRDASVLDLLEGLPAGAPAGGIYWVNDTAPRRPLLDWLEAQNTIWAPYSDFEGLMYLLRREFTLGHPRIDRFDKILRRYDEQYKDLATRQDLAREADAAWSTPVSSVAAKPAAEDASEEAERQSDDSEDWGLTIGDRYSQEDVIDETEISATEADEGWSASEPGSEAATARAGPFRAFDGGRETPTEPRTVEPRNATTSRSVPGPSFASGGATGQASAAPALEDTQPRGRIDILIAAAVEAMANEHGDADEEDLESRSDAAESADDRPPLELVTRVEDEASEDDTAPDEAAAELRMDTALADAVRDMPGVSTERAADFELQEPEQSIDAYARDFETVEADAPETIDLPEDEGEDAHAPFSVAEDDIPADAASPHADETPDDIDTDLAASAERSETDLLPIADETVDEDDGETKALDALIADFESAQPDPEEESGTDTLPAENDAPASVEADAAPEPLREPAPLRAVPVSRGLIERLTPRTATAAASDLDGSGDETGLHAPVRLLPRGEAAALDRRFMAALQDSPNNARLLAEYAQFLAKGRRDYDGAEHYFNRAFDADPRDGRTLRSFASFLTDVRRDYERAEDCYRLALRADFENADILCDYAEFLWKSRGDFDAAGECFQVAVDSAPRNARVLAAYATFLAEVEGNADAAYALLKLASASTHKDPEPVIELAKFVATQRGDLPKAEAAYRRAMAIAPDSAPTVAAAAEFLGGREETAEEAQTLFERAMDIDALCPDVLRKYASFKAVKLDDRDGAGELLRRAIDADPGDAHTALAYARFLELERKDYNTADEYYRRAVHLDPRDAGILAAHARFLHAIRKNPAGAEDRFRKALRLEPNNPQILADLGSFLLSERRNLDAAEPMLRRSIELMPNNAVAHSDLGKLLRERGDEEGAEDAFRRAVSIDPKGGEALRRYARFVSTSRTDPKAAEEFYRRALDENPEDASTLGGAAQAMFALGRKEEGLTLLDRAFESALAEQPRNRDLNLLLELWFYRYAFDDRAGSDSIRAALWLVRAGGRARRRDLDAVLDSALSAGHRHAQVLKDLAAVACGEMEPGILEQHEVA